MVHHEVLEMFKKMLSFGGEDHITKIIKDWFPNGKNSIRVRFVNNDELIFTYNSPTRWSIITKDEFVDNMKKEKK